MKGPASSDLSALRFVGSQVVGQARMMQTWVQNIVSVNDLCLLPHSEIRLFAALLHHLLAAPPTLSLPHSPSHHLHIDL